MSRNYDSQILQKHLQNCRNLWFYKPGLKVKADLKLITLNETSKDRDKVNGLISVDLAFWVTTYILLKLKLLLLLVISYYLQKTEIINDIVLAFLPLYCVLRGSRNMNSNRKFFWICITLLKIVEDTSRTGMV